MRKGHKILLGFSIAVGALVLAAGIALYIISRDEPPPDDSDLQVHRLDIPDGQNGFTYFQKAGEVLYWPGTEAWKKSGKHPEPEDVDSNPDDPQVKAAVEVGDRLDWMMVGKKWDEALAAEVLDANKETLALIEKGLACREFQVPEVKSFCDPTRYVSFGFLQTARFMLFSANDLAARGKSIEAVERALEVVFFSHRIECAKGCLLNSLIGQTIKGMGLEQLRHLVVECKVPAETLKMIAARLAEWEDGGTGLADALCCEYQMYVNTVDEIYRGDKNIKSITTCGQDQELLRPSWFERLEVRLFLKPNMTKRMFAETFRLMLEDITGPYAAAHALPTARRGSDGLLQMLLSNNSVGIRLRETLIAANSGVVPLKGRIQTDLAATLVIVAIKAFKMKTGRLPKTLDELVPEYLAAVPLDDFDGKPLRYSPEKKILYSVGKNLKDVGGSTKEEIQKWCEKEYPSQPPEDTYSVSVPVWNLPNPSWPIEF